MYGKVFSQMYEGTLAGHWQAIVTMQQLIVLADADGIVDMTPEAISRRTSIPLNIIEDGLKVLSEPDKYSRTPGEDGRRIVCIDEHRPWGWQLVNYLKYKHLKDSDEVREQNRVRAQRFRDKRNAPSRSVTLRNAESRHIDTDKDKANTFADFWSAYPRKVAKQDALKAFLKLKLQNGDFDKVLAALAVAKKSDQWCRDGGKFIPHPATWLNGRRFEDEPPPPAELRLAI